MILNAYQCILIMYVKPQCSRLLHMATFSSIKTSSKINVNSLFCLKTAVKKIRLQQPISCIFLIPLPVLPKSLHDFLASLGVGWQS